MTRKIPRVFDPIPGIAATRRVAPLCVPRAGTQNWSGISGSSWIFGWGLAINGDTWDFWLLLTGTWLDYDFPYISKNHPN